MIRVILVDDAGFAFDRLSRLLLVFEEIKVVSKAIDGDSALEEIERHHPDAVLLDLQMPRKSRLQDDFTFVVAQGV